MYKHVTTYIEMHWWSNIFSGKIFLQRWLKSSNTWSQSAWRTIHASLKNKRTNRDLYLVWFRIGTLNLPPKPQLLPPSNLLHVRNWRTFPTLSRFINRATRTPQRTTNLFCYPPQKDLFRSLNSQQFWSSHNPQARSYKLRDSPSHHPSLRPRYAGNRKKRNTTHRTHWWPQSWYW